MPAICDLNRLRERFLSRESVTAAPIARDDGDLWLAREPCLCRRRFAIREQRNRFATFEIADDRPVALVASPCPVVDSDYCRGIEVRVPRLRTRRRRVSLLTGNIKRRAKLAAGRPPKASAR
jgi:hypothetical protein